MIIVLVLNIILYGLNLSDYLKTIKQYVSINFILFRTFPCRFYEVHIEIKFVIINIKYRLNDT